MISSMKDIALIMFYSVIILGLGLLVFIFVSSWITLIVNFIRDMLFPVKKGQGIIRRINETRKEGKGNDTHLS